jgi:hypothetical protein
MSHCSRMAKGSFNGMVHPADAGHSCLPLPHRPRVHCEKPWREIAAPHEDAHEGRIETNVAVA